MLYFLTVFVELLRKALPKTLSSSRPATTLIVYTVTAVTVYVSYFGFVKALILMIVINLFT